jgi:hypothetical protein
MVKRVHPAATNSARSATACSANATDSSTSKSPAANATGSTTTRTVLPHTTSASQISTTRTAKFSATSASPAEAASWIGFLLRRDTSFLRAHLQALHLGEKGLEDPSRVIVLGGAGLDRRGLVLQLSTHLMLRRVDAGDNSVEEIEALLELVDRSARRVPRVAHGVEDVLRLQGRFGGRRGVPSQSSNRGEDLQRWEKNQPKSISS